MTLGNDLWISGRIAAKGAIWIMNASTFEVEAELTKHNSEVYMCQAIGDLVWSVSWDKMIYTWRPEVHTHSPSTPPPTPKLSSPLPAHPFHHTRDWAPSFFLHYQPLVVHDSRFIFGRITYSLHKSKISTLMQFKQFFLFLEKKVMDGLFGQLPLIQLLMFYLYQIIIQKL